MLRNYLIIAVRNLLRHKVFSFINILGLTIGMACCFLILLFVEHEFSYDTFHTKADRIYRVTYDPKFAGLPRPIAAMPPPAAPLFKAYFPEIAHAARLYQRNVSIKVLKMDGVAEEKYEEERFFFADTTLLNIFTIPFLLGNPATALVEPYSVVITDEIARKYFGTNWSKRRDVLGHTLLFEGKQPMRITGVVKAFPDNSHLHFDFLSSYETMFALESPGARENLPRNWVITHSYTYVLLKPGQQASAVNAKFPAFLLRHAPSQLSKDIVYTLQPLKDIHLKSNLLMEVEPVGSLTYVYVFLGIALITLLIACINFINLSTARSLKRAREVGMRKVLGAAKRQLIGQFLGESFLMSGLAFLLSLLLMTTLLPTLNELTQKHLSIANLLSSSFLMGAFVAVFLLTGGLAGSYPAFFVSKFQPIETLKGSFTSGKARGGILRQALVVLQFAASIALIIGAVTTFRQLQFMRNQPMGFQKDYIVTASMLSDNFTNVFAQPNDSAYWRLKTFIDILKENPDVASVTLSNQEPGQGATRRGVVPEGFTEESNQFISCLAVDYNFIGTYGLKILAGRDFSPSFKTDPNDAFIINETGARSFGWNKPEDALGKNIDREGKKGKIIGVVRDFHSQSLHEPITGLLMDVDLPVLSVFSIRINSARIPETLDFIGKKWNVFFPDKVFDYQFLDQRISRLYEREQRLGQVIGYFAGLAIIISCLGLYGLVSLVVGQRTKEIGIRKVMGASAGNIVYLLSGNFVVLVCVAFVLAVPVAWWGLSQWLREFAYRIDISWWIFAVSGMLVLLIALLTISMQAIRAALSNPVKSLRTE
jgi:putative ABC transport system permease protein